MKKLWKELTHNKLLFAGLIIVGFLFLMMIVSLFWTPHDPYYIPNSSEGMVMMKPNWEYPLGTDYLGRCTLSRIMKASQMAFLIGFSTLAISGAIGITLGLVGGYYGGIVDEIIMRFVDMWMSIPGMLLLLVFIAIFGGGTIQTIVAISLMNFSTFVKMTRSKVVSIKESDYILWAKNIGVPQSRIIFIHILPELSPILLVIAAMKFSGAIMAEAGLSYLGLGIKDPDPSWGNILNRAQSMLTTNIFYAIIPGLLITLLVIGSNLISDGLKKKFNIIGK